MSPSSTTQPHELKLQHYSLSGRGNGEHRKLEADNINNSVSVVRTSRPTTSKISMQTYNSWLGMLRIRKYSAFWTRADQTNETGIDTHIHTKRIVLNVQLVEWLCSYQIKLHVIRQMGHWSYTLYPVHKISQDSLLFEFCKEGDLANVLRLFEKKLASPFDASPKGNTALHVSFECSRARK